MRIYPLKKILLTSLNIIFPHNLSTYPQTVVFISVNKNHFINRNFNSVNNNIFMNIQNFKYTHDNFNFNRLVERKKIKFLNLSPYTQSLLLKLIFLYKKKR